jgi:CoA:oxalate CoA-transferase
MVVQAMGGIMSITGEEGGRPVRVGVSIGDLTAGLFATIGTQGALLERVRTECGSHVDISMLDCQVSLLENAVARQLATGETPRRHGSRHPSITPFDVYEAADGFLAICAGNESQFVKLMEIIGHGALADDERFNSIAARNEHEQELKAVLENVLKTWPRSYWLAKMELAGIPCGPINSIADLVEDPQVISRGMIVEVVDPRSGTLRMAATPVRLSSAARSKTHRPAPELDGDRLELLAELGAIVAPAH